MTKNQVIKKVLEICDELNPEKQSLVLRYAKILNQGGNQIDALNNEFQSRMNELTLKEAAEYIDKMERAITAAKKYYTLQEVAAALQVDERSVYRFIKDGRLHGMKVGRVWRFSQEDLDAFDRAQRDKNSL